MSKITIANQTDSIATIQFLTTCYHQCYIHHPGYAFLNQPIHPIQSTLPSIHPSIHSLVGLFNPYNDEQNVLYEYSYKEKCGLYNVLQSRYAAESECSQSNRIRPNKGVRKRRLLPQWDDVGG